MGLFKGTSTEDLAELREATHREAYRLYGDGENAKAAGLIAQVREMGEQINQSLREG